MLTGFLGSGKTTLLARLLRDPPAPGGRPERLAVLVNEVADLPLDAQLLSRVDLETLDEDVLALPSGCLCCALRGELHGALQRLAARRPDRIVVETTGLADPGPLLHGLATDAALAAVVRPAGVVAVVDALRAEDLAAEQPEFLRQLEFADRLVLTKGDLAPARLPGVRALLAEAAPGCELAEVVDGDVDPTWLLAAPPLARLTGADDVSRWLHHGDGGDGGGPSGSGPAPDVTTRSLRRPEPVDIEALQLWLVLAVMLDGPRLLRVKLLADDRDGDTWVLQSAGRSVSPPRRLAARPAGHTGLQAVLVERGLGADALAALLSALTEAAEGRPARATS